MRNQLETEIIWTSKPPRLFVEPRCNTIMWIGIGSIAVGVAGIGMSAAGVGAPSYAAAPNMAASSQQIANAQASLLPLQRGIEAAALKGGKYSYSLPNIPGVNWSKYGVDSTSGSVDFTGLGQADIQAANANKTAANNLALSQQYDPLFIAEALKEQNLADPESAKARQTEAQLIQGQIDRPQNSPVTDMLDAQVADTLKAANNNSLTDMDTERLNAAVAAAKSDRGGGTAPQADFAAPLTTGFAGEARQANALNNARGWLASGSSPADVAYRREQQNLSNLSAEASGKTPESQFSSMSGAQNGPTPAGATQGNNLALMPHNQSQAFASQQLQNWQTQNSYNAQQANPWMAGLSSLSSLLGGAAGAFGGSTAKA